MSTFIEELSLNAWPALQTVLHDGWVIRFANGYTKRANSVNPLYPSAIDLDAKIRFCEGIYENKKLPVVFKINSGASPDNLDTKLLANDYRKDSLTSVQVMELETASVQIAGEVELQGDLSAGWLDNFCRMSAVAEPNRKTLRQILTHIIPCHCFVS
ncbi:MAG TPA: hypothetical protein VFQ13_02410, partial [Anaerolineales bacterium]|nr:hypothetical protein [Anaerolineales bacterium]